MPQVFYIHLAGLSVFKRKNGRNICLFQRKLQTLAKSALFSILLPGYFFKFNTMKKKLWYEAPEAELLDIRPEASILSPVSVSGNSGEDLDDPVSTNPWS